MNKNKCWVDINEAATQRRKRSSFEKLWRNLTVYERSNMIYIQPPKITLRIKT